MSTQRSLFTEAIEDHLALKKQNSPIEQAMPLARFDVGDPLDRYPGGPVREEAVAVPVAGTPADAGPAIDTMGGPTPAQALESAQALDPSYAGRPLEPLGGMTPMLSLVEDLDDEDDDAAAGATAMFGSAASPEVSGHVLRFPGGVGPREDSVEMPSADGAPTVVATVAGDQMLTGEQPVIVVDADEPFAATDAPQQPTRSASVREGRRPRFFGLGKRRKAQEAPTEGWFTDGPRDFDWE